MRINRPSESTNRRSPKARELSMSAFSIQHSAFSISRSERAFTMIEIAIAAGVIGFAALAIIGILPLGFSSQKDNREDTIISQDAPYFLNAIRNGEQRTNNNILTGYVESITVATSGSPSATNTYTNPALLGSGGSNAILTNDAFIIGLLSTPEFDSRIPTQSNAVTAIVRAMSGSAVNQAGPAANMAFRYQLTVEIDPWIPPPGTPTAYANYLSSSLRDVRLKFAWPVLPPNNTIGSSYQKYRSLISSHLWWASPGAVQSVWFFQPQTYTTNLAGP
jgi:type II secretory pathway pseudopilin PulG